MRRQIFRKVALERLSSPERLDELMLITSPAGWLALAALVVLLLVAVVWSVLATVELPVEGRAMLKAPDGARPTEAVVSVPATIGLQVRPGMEVRIYPADVDRESYGFLRGNVAAVAQAQPAADTAPATLAVRVALVSDPATPSGYRWSLPPGPSIALADGMAGSATIILAQRHPISFVLPLR